MGKVALTITGKILRKKKTIKLKTVSFPKAGKSCSR